MAHGLSLENLKIFLNSKAIRILSCVSCMFLIVSQSVVLNMYLVRSHGPIHWLWILGDASVVVIFFVYFVAAFKKKVPELTQLDVSFIVWIVYASLIGARIVLLFLGPAQHLKHTDSLGPNVLNFCISLTAPIFLLLIMTHRIKDLTPNFQIYIDGICHTVTFDILDTVSMLEVLFVQDSRVILPFDIHYGILGVVCSNLLVPSLSLMGLSRVLLYSCNFKCISAFHEFFNLILVNVPLLVLRSFIWWHYNGSISVFYMKNILAIIYLIKKLFIDMYNGKNLPPELERVEMQELTKE